MESLLTQLTDQSSKFKIDFVERYKKAVIREFDFYNDNYSINTVYDQVGEEAGLAKGKIYGTRKEYFKAQSILAILYDYHHGRIEKRIEKEVEEAKQSFDNKIHKLVFRMEEKGFIGKVIVVSAFVGVNFECTITCGDKTINAYTIVAEGPIQRPHYRYLIK